MIILTTANDDAALHEYGVEISLERLSQGKCKVDIWGWGRISEQIGVHEKIQHIFYKHTFRQLSLRQWAIRAIVGALTLTMAIACLYVFRDRLNVKSQRANASIHQLQTFVELTDDLQSKYVGCDKILSKKLFVFSGELKTACTDPIGLDLNKIEKQLEKVGALLDSQAWSEINSLSGLMTEDFRQSLMAVHMTRHFEDQVINELSGYCKGSLRSHENDNKTTYEAARAAMLEQLKYYFVLRDFILPGLTSMKARALVQARTLANEPIPADLERQANELGKNLQERRAYIPPEIKQPFTISAVKVWTSRSIKTPSDSEDNPIESARWNQVQIASLSQAFVGRPNDIERLIECGVMRPEARSLVSAH